MSDEPVIVERSGQRVTISLNRPQVINALNIDMLRMIDKALDDAERDEDVRVIVLRGNGDRGFCSGLDTKMLAKYREEGAEEAPLTFVRLYALAKRIDAFPKPVISLAHGHCIAAGAQLATAADIVIAADNLKMMENELRSGGFNDESWAMRLGRNLGKLRAKRFVLLIETIGAELAENMGLVSLVVPTAELDATGDRVAEQICSYMPRVVISTLAMIDRGVEGRD